MIEFLSTLTGLCLWSVLAVIAVAVLLLLLYVLFGVVTEFLRRK